jgi:pimeloyl-ACP methyl ester carboxylesterase
MAHGHQIQASYVDVPTDGRMEKIHVLTAGPTRSPPTPAVIFISGLGTPCLGFATVMRQLAKAGIPSYTHDRTGIGRSRGNFPSEKPRLPDDKPATLPKGMTDDPLELPESTKSPEESRSATQMADHLAAWLDAAKIAPPYVVVMHSYAGVIGREFIAKHLSNVLGAVFIDTNCESAVDRGLDIPEIETLLGSEGIDFWEDTGLGAQHQLEPQEWAELTKGGDLPPGFERGAGGGKAEAGGYFKSVKGLKRLRQYEEHVLGRKPISVIKGTIDGVMTKLLDRADERNAGPRELRERVRSQLVGFNDNELKLQRAQLRLSEEGCGRMVDVKDAGHYVHVSHPQLVTKEIEWVVEQAQDRGFLKQWEASQAKS